MTEKFKEFLEENKALCSYKEYNKNIKDDSLYTLFDYFDWNETTEGYKFWDDLDEEWFWLLQQDESTKLKCIGVDL